MAYKQLLHSVLRKRLLSVSYFSLFALLVLLAGVLIKSSPAYALSESYKWRDKTSLVGTGGRYGDQKIVFSASEAFTPGRDNVPPFTTGTIRILDKPSGCGVIVDLTFSGKDTSKAAVNVTPDTLGATNSGCDANNYPSQSDYSSPVTLAGSPSGESTPEQKFKVNVTSQITSGETYTSDKIILKYFTTQKVVTTKNVGKSDAFNSPDYVGFKTAFSNVSNKYQYSVCSEKLGICSDVSTPIDGSDVNVLITKDIDLNTGGTTCAIDGVGWIVCPVATFLSTLNDGAFGFLKKLLAVQPSLITNSATKDAWAAFRDIANVAFIISFLVIVYSQITGVGISNYGVKKLLPKIFIAAILVNLSYYICAIAVDLSNILGSSIYSLLGDLPIGADGKTGGGFADGWHNSVGTILAAGTASIVLLVVVLPVLPVVLLALALILLILIARQAFVLILLVVSPLAFVAYLLPNTETWFKKWRQAFFTTLMVYPIIGAIFGGSTMAATILMRVAQNGSDGSGGDSQLLGIVALATLALPLFAVPLALKGAMAASGQLGARLQGVADKGHSRALKSASARSKELYNNSAYARGRALRQSGKKKYKDERFADALNNGGGATGTIRRRAARGFGANAVAQRIPFVRKGAEKSSSYIDRAAFGEANRADNEEVGFTTSQITSAAVAEASRTPGTHARDVLQRGFADALARGDSVSARAHYDALRGTGEEGVEAARKTMVDSNTAGRFSGKKGEAVKADLMKHMHANSDSVKKKDVRQDRFKNTGDFADLVAPSSFAGITDAQIASQTLESLQSAHSAGNLTSADATRILANPDVSADLKGKKRAFLETI